MSNKHEELSGLSSNEADALGQDGGCRETHVYVADNRRLHREGLVTLIRAHSDDLSVSGVESVGEALSQIAQASDNPIVLLTGERDASGHCARMDDEHQVSSGSPDTPVLVVCACKELSCMRDCIGKGAKGFITPDSNGQTLVEALHLVKAGGTFVPMASLSLQGGAEATASDQGSPLTDLTSKEQRVLELMCKGKSNLDIAGELAQSQNTVKSHINRILKKLAVKNRTQVVLAALPYVTVNAPER